MPRRGPLELERRRELDERYLKKEGMTYRAFKAVPIAIRAAYQDQCDRARSRGLGWHFTLASWMAVWKASGHFEERGRGKSGYCMARYNDTGPYSPDNVYICTNSQNFKDHWVLRKALRHGEVECSI